MTVVYTDGGAHGLHGSQFSSQLDVPLPADILAALARIKEQYELALGHTKRERVYWLNIGEAYFKIKEHPLLDECGGIKAITPLLPRTPQFLNRCALAWHGFRTGDLALGEQWVQDTDYPLQNGQEPYLSAEIVTAYRNRQEPRPPGPSAIELIEAKPFVRNHYESFEGLGAAAFGNCHELICDVPPETFDLVLFDPPFGIVGRRTGPSLRRMSGKTEHEWDRPLDWPLLWPEIWRVTKRTGTVVICAAEPLASVLIASNLESFLYRQNWCRKASNIFQSKWRPLGVIEPIPIFSRASQRDRTYNAQTEKLKQTIDRLARRRFPFLGAVRDYSQFPARALQREHQPTDLIVVPRHPLDRPTIQDCQKPVELLRYLIRTYSHPGELVLDLTAGSFTTAIACHLELRKFICFEQHEAHFMRGVQRLRSVTAAAV